MWIPPHHYRISIVRESWENATSQVSTISIVDIISPMRYAFILHGILFNRVKNVLTLENVHHVTRMIPRLGEMAYEDRPKRLKLPTLSFRHNRDI